MFKDYVPILVMIIFILIVQLLALFLSIPMEAGDMQAFEDPESAANPLYYIVLILLFTGLILLSIKKNMQWIIQSIVLLAVMATLYFVVFVVLESIGFSSIIGLLAAALISVGLTSILYVYPEWYIINFTGIIIAAGASAIFGISLAIGPVILLLIILAIYDAISVYKTKHMLSLADGAIDMKLPILFVVPKKLNYSFKQTSSNKHNKDEAFLMGLGDAVIPTILVVSAYVFVDYNGLIPYHVLGAILGTIIGYFTLTMLVMKGKPQAGLPFLNSGVILGYVAGCLIGGIPILG
ncbi:hypothetical protein D5R95_07105 [Methanosalsum natronophilum]|uniref:Signal-peptide peptidase, presenilin aspartyl protease n=1 Tax=Methanosalsum natronophilum TaxID=768733 RepID=A0A3R7XGJ0_9EURY|nr:MAG: hypothetical protein D5R95_07105 [Methanosalsum natronophilum]